ncbi:MAG: ABC transporter permease [Caldilinea sp.]|nr:ABC transporter permease [Caldilineaceae bacterium]MCO5211709.1 ABC transporter permease [Caldilinea sp.]MCW5842087.1 ABC transporter permease [Caldilinea sp.]
MRPDWSIFRRWEGLLLILLILIVGYNALSTPGYLTVGNWVNLFQLSIEKIIVALIMTFIIINAEIDLSVASVMGFSACMMGFLFAGGMPMEWAIAGGLLAGFVAGLFNSFWIGIVGLPSLVVTLAGLIGYRGLAYVLLEDRSIGEFPAWFDRLGQQPLIGPFPLALIVFFVLLIFAIIVLQYSGFGRYVYVIGNSKDVARYSGVRVRRTKMILFVVSSTVAALAGILYAARLGAVRGDMALGFELDIITMVLLGGVSIFGGTGTMWGVLLSVLIILNLRNGMGLANFSGHVQTGVIGVLLILSVLVPNLAGTVQAALKRRRARTVEVVAAE